MDPISYLVTFGPAMLAFWIGFWRGHIRGRRKEFQDWQDEVAPKLKRLTGERDALWRSAVAKTQKLNRLRKGQ